MLTIPGYKILKQLSNGESTLVLKAERISDSYPVILKVIEQSSHDIEHEAKMFRLFNNDYIVQIIDVVKIENKYILVFEDDNAIALKTWLGEKNLSVDNLIDIALKITEAIHTVHLQGIIHNNINPSNFIINPETEQVKLIDFRIAGHFSPGNPISKETGTLDGNIEYMAPEQSQRTNSPIDYCSDLYSIGIVLYELLTGKLPFTSDDLLELTHAHFVQLPEPPHNIKPELPQIISQIILKLLEKNPADRYQSAYGLLGDLKKFRNGLNEYPLGEHDYSAVLKITPKLYGREKEIEQLKSVYENVMLGGSEFMVVTGYSGVGKSSLVNEIQNTVIEQEGSFISGKFDQFESITPYTAIKQAFNALIRQLLSEPEEILNNWKSNLLGALNINGQIILDVIPELELIIGKQKTIQQLGPVESKERFMRVFLDFVKVFAKPDHTLALFLDDLQWIDQPSLDLIKLLITKKTPNLFIIGAYRDNEVRVGHSLLSAFDELKQAQKIHQLHLEPLACDTLNQFIADTFQKEPEDTEGLSNFIFQKTNGNPFFTKELITNFYKEGLIQFNHTKAIWRWNLEKIKSINIEGNVVSFMIERLKKLAKPNQEALQLAACIGNQFVSGTLALVLKKDIEHVINLLSEAINEGLITSLSDSKKGVINTKILKGKILENIEYRFSHDRVQQAAYSLIEEDKRAETHLKIGNLLLQNYGVENPDDHIVEIVRHLNKGISLLKKHEEREKLADLNLQVGIKAQNASAFHSALQYFRAGLDLLPENKWEKLYELTFSLHREFAQSSYFADNFEEADAYCKLLLDNAKTNIEKANVYSLQSAYYVATGDYEQSIKSGVKGLSIIGFRLPEKPGKQHILKEVLRIKWKLTGKKVSDLYNAPAITEPRLKLIMSLLTEVSYAGSMSDRNMQILVSFKMVNLSLRFGYTAESALAFSNYAIALIAAFGDYKNAAKYNELSIFLNERFPDIRVKTIVTSMTSMVKAWYEHWSLLTERFQKAIEYGYQSGDKFMFSRVAQMKVMFNPCMNLKNVSEEQYKNTQIIKETAFLEDAYNSSLLFYHMVLNFRGLTNDRSLFNYENFDESQLLQRIKDRKYFPGIVVYNLFKAEACLLYSEFYKGLEFIQEATKYLKYMPPICYIVRHSLLVFVLNSRSYHEMGKKEKKQAIKQMYKQYKKMKKWAKHCPVNFFHLLLIMDAEKARLSGHFDKAAKLFEEAIEKAAEGQWRRDEATACELLADMYRMNGHNVAANAYLKEAYNKYEAWGAHGKTTQLKEKWPNIFEPDENNDSSDSQIETNTPALTLDLAAIIKASQAISGEIAPEMLFKKMMQVLVENAGAQKGYLILNTDNELFVEASFSDNEIQVLQHLPVKHCEDLAQSIINYVSRSKMAVVLDDAKNKGQYTKDAYIETHDVKSLFAVPILRQNKLYGLLYLENNLITSAFTIEQQKVLNMLSGQIAISIENALLYGHLEEKVSARTKELKDKNEEYEALNEELTTTNEKLVALDEFKKNMTGSLVHDLKTPLNTIINLATSTSLRVAGKQMLNMVMNILDVYKLEEGAMQLDLKDSPIYEIIGSSISEVAYLAKQKDIKLTHNTSTSIVVNVDEKIIERILVNLLSNAIKYSPESSIVTVNCKWNEDENTNKVFTIEVKDNGPGIRKIIQDKIFERFAQFEAKDSGSTPSTGLGLAFCKMAIDAHNGEIGVESEVDRGSTFWFTLPNARIVDIQSRISNKELKDIDKIPQKKRAEIIEVLNELNALDVYFITKIKEPLTKIKELEIEQLVGWTKEIDNSLEHCNNEKYHELLDELKLILNSF